MTEYDIVQGNTIGSFPVNNSPSHVQATLIPACMDAIRAIVREEFYAHIVEEQEQKLNEIFESANNRDWEDSDQLQSAISKGHIKLDEQSSVWIDHDSNEVHLYNQGELSSLSPKQALSLLLWLIQKRKRLQDMIYAPKGGDDAH